MSKRLPDELFREAGSTESADVRVDSQPVDPAEARPRLSSRSRDAKEFAPALVVAGVVAAMLLGFGVGKLVVGQPAVPATAEGANVSTTTSASASPTPESTLVPWNGSVVSVPVVAAEGRCQDSISVNPPSNLLDDDPLSVWSCRGAGVGESIVFTLEKDAVVVGIRLVNGNTISPDRYLAERRILSIKWTFDDGSWLVQGLAANDRQAQEVRFPPTTMTGDVTMTVLDATVPGDADSSKDAISISSLQFLGVP